MRESMNSVLTREDIPDCCWVRLLNTLSRFLNEKAKNKIRQSQVAKKIKSKLLVAALFFELLNKL